LFIRIGLRTLPLQSHLLLLDDVDIRLLQGGRESDVPVVHHKRVVTIGSLRSLWICIRYTVYMDLHHSL